MQLIVLALSSYACDELGLGDDGGGGSLIGVCVHLLALIFVCSLSCYREFCSSELFVIN